MERMKKVGLVLVMVIVMMLSMVACGDESGGSDKADSAETTTAAKTENPIVGDWILTTIIVGEDKEYTLEEYCKAQGVDSEGMEMTFSFADDGTLVAGLGGVETPGTYTFENDVMTYTANGQSASINYDSESDMMYISDEKSGTTTILERQ